MFDLAQLEALAAVHRRGAFDLAAAELNVTPSAISQRIKALEEAAGAVLVRRGQPCTATETGRRLVRHHDELALLNRALAAELTLPAAPAVLRIAINADSLATWAIPALAAVPGFLYDLVIEDEDTARELLKRGEVAGAITSNATPLQGCDTISLGQMTFRAAASPDFAARWFPQGVTEQALARAPSLRFNDKDRLQARWAARFGATGVLPSHRIASSHGFADACLAGLGWAMNAAPLVDAHIAQGRLIDLSPGSPLLVPLSWQFNRLTARAIQPLTRALQDAARAL